MMGKAMAEVIMNEQNRQAALVALLSYQRDLGVDLRLSSNGMNRFDEVASDAATQRGSGCRVVGSGRGSASRERGKGTAGAWPYEHPKHGGKGPNHGRCRPNIAGFGGGCSSL